MTPEQFAYWLNGFAELNPSMEQPTPEQWKSITEHLKTVFVKVTPLVGSKFLDECRKRFDPTTLPFGPFPSAPMITC